MNPLRLNAIRSGWLCDTSAELLEEVDRLRAIVGELPHTADGVAMFGGEDVWFPGEEKPGRVGGEAALPNLFMCGNRDWGAAVGECYSTKEAAYAAEAAAAAMEADK